MSSRYSDRVMDHFQNPQHRGSLPEASGTGVWGVPGSGPFFVLQIRLEGNQISAAAFQSHSCGVTVACGSVISTILHGMDLDDAGRLTSEALIEALDGVPVDKRHIPEMVIRTLQQAIHEAAS